MLKSPATVAYELAKDAEAMAHTLIERRFYRDAARILTTLETLRRADNARAWLRAEVNRHKLDTSTARD